MEIKINQQGYSFEIEIDGKKLERVESYKLTSSAGGTTELEVKFGFANTNVSLNSEKSNSLANQAR